MVLGRSMGRRADGRAIPSRNHVVDGLKLVPGVRELMCREAQEGGEKRSERSRYHTGRVGICLALSLRSHPQLS